MSDRGPYYYAIQFDRDPVRVIAARIPRSYAIDQKSTRWPLVMIAPAWLHVTVACPRRVYALVRSCGAYAWGVR